MCRIAVWQGLGLHSTHYKHWKQLLLRHIVNTPVTILIREGLTRGYPLSMVLYGIALIPLAEELQAPDPEIVAPFYADDAAFDGSAQRSAQLLNMFVER